jgi:hypothetical protein
MQAVIGGLRYDTNKATLIGEASANCSRSDFEWWEAGLWRTPNGRYFLAGRGGAKTLWARPVDGSTISGKTGGSGIKLLTADEARTWAKANLTPRGDGRGRRSCPAEWGSRDEAEARPGRRQGAGEAL